MTTYINTVTSEYPLYQGDMELRFPNFDGTSLHEDYATVVQGAIPICTETQRLTELEPILIDGVWTKQFIAVEVTQEELDQRAKNKNVVHGNSRDVTAPGSAPNVIE